MPASTSPQNLSQIANQVRINIIDAVFAAGSGHPAGALGIADVLTLLYFQEMNVGPELRQDANRDRFVLSAAHMVPGLYGVLAEKGYFPRSELKTLRELGSRLQGHTFLNTDIGVETTGGSLGQGLSIALGFALNARMDKLNYRTYCIIGDGESNEGQIWEAAMFAAKEKLDNLCVILDRNHIQQTNTSDVIMPLEPLIQKWEAFGWQVFNVDGHELTQVAFALQKARFAKGKPSILIANTIPGKGVSFMENKYEWHAKAPNQEEYEQAMKELGI